MPLLPEDRERLIRYLDFLESERADFPRFSRVDWKTYQSDRDLRRNLERWIENLVNCAIDIAKVILVCEGRGIPSTYREALKELGSLPYFDPEFGEDISRWAALRNILAHQYLGIRWQSIDRFLRESESSFGKLAQGVRSLIA